MAVMTGTALWIKQAGQRSSNIQSSVALADVTNSPCAGSLSNEKKHSLKFTIF